VGVVDGATKGMVDGAAVGAVDGATKGMADGAAVGAVDGSSLGNQDHSSVSAVAGGAGDFLAHFLGNQDHSSVSAVAGGAGDFLAHFLGNQEHSSVSTVAGGAGDFLANQDHSSVSAVVTLKTDAQIARQRKKKIRWRKNKKRRINAHQATSPSMIHQEGKTLCVFYQCGFCGWCARGNYECTCCEGATSIFGYAL
jgi:hypothetical protein